MITITGSRFSFIRVYLILCLVSLGFLLSCGLEDIAYIDYIPPGEYDTTIASVRLPSSSADGYSSNSYFQHFEIFYRIYTSNNNPSGKIETDLARTSISPRLNMDYSALYPYTDFTSTTVSTINSNTFTSRGYFKLELENANINQVLSGGSLGKTLVINFPGNTSPTLSLQDAAGITGPYVLQRDSKLELPTGFSYDFLNRPQLYTNAITVSQPSAINADVFANAATAAYTYVSMYIVAQGADFITTVFSQPTFLGIFQLANAN